jgi:penicillin amidase
MALAALALSGLALIASSGTAEAPAPGRRVAGETVLALPGLSRPVRVVTDRWGIPHLRAENLPDLYFAWGFVTARDRLWQLETTRRAASGSLWEWFGNRTLTADGGAQLFRLRERAEHIWERERSLPNVREPLERYAAGINAWIDRCRSGAEPWPAEFLRLQRQPSPWRPEYAYMVLLAQAMLLDLDLPELDEADEIRAHGMIWERDRQRFERDMTVASIPDSVARRLYATGAGHAGAALPPAREARHGAAATPPDAGAPLLAEARRTVAGWLDDDGGGATREPDERASNFFAVGPGRSARGVPLLANDPHLGLSDPNPLHVVHLSVPGMLEAAGASVPGLPLIVSGRNQRCAWGLTASGADVIDVYADTLSKSGQHVRWRGAWMRVSEEAYSMRYRVLGLVPIPLFGRARRYTPHGPVIAYDKKKRIALSVCWAGNDAAITLERLLGLERSASAVELTSAIRTLITPTHNFLAADRDGHVIYQVAGAFPRRGFEPPPGVLPGDGRHEWQGLIAPDALPRWELGPRDLVANGNNLPVRVPYPEPFVRYDFMQDRAARMIQRLAGDPSMTMADMVSVQNDVYSRGAARFLPRLLACADSLAGTRTPRVQAALDSLRAWDGYARRDRLGPTLYRSWLNEFQHRSRLDGVPMLAAAALDGRAPGALRAPAGDTLERPAVAATRALELALTDLEQRFGPDMNRWRWGHAHRARFRHALAWKDSTLEARPIPVDGDQSTVSVGRSSVPWSTAVTHGPVWRHVVDLAAPESSLCVLPPGNAGAGRHARDMMVRWANHGYVPLYLDWSRIAAVTETETRLEPGAAR